VRKILMIVLLVGLASFTSIMAQDNVGYDSDSQADIAHLRTTIAKQADAIQALMTDKQKAVSDNIDLQSTIDREQLRVQALVSQLQDMDSANRLLKQNSDAQASQIVSLQNSVDNMQNNMSSESQLLPTASASILDHSHRALLCLRHGCEVIPDHRHLDLSRLDYPIQERLNVLIKSQNVVPIIFTVFVLLILVIIILILYRYSLLRSQHESREFSKPRDQDLAAVSGEDIYASQIDLVHAYIEMKDFRNAKLVLKKVLKSRHPEHIKIAKALMLKVKAMQKKSS
jgi:FimV-like protein